MFNLRVSTLSIVFTVYTLSTISTVLTLSTVYTVLTVSTLCTLCTVYTVPILSTFSTVFTVSTLLIYCIFCIYLSSVCTLSTVSTLSTVFTVSALSTIYCTYGELCSRYWQPKVSGKFLHSFIANLGQYDKACLCQLHFRHPPLHALQFNLSCILYLFLLKTQSVRTAFLRAFWLSNHCTRSQSFINIRKTFRCGIY